MSKTTETNPDIVKLISEAFDEKGYPIRKGMRIRQQKARAILADENYVATYNTVNGCDSHDGLLMIAHPNKEI